MAKTCCACNASISFFDLDWEIDKLYPEYVLCSDCNKKLKALETASEEEYHRIAPIFKELLINPAIPLAVKEKIPLHLEEKQEILINTEFDTNKIILTTSSHFDGYRVTKYIDIICEEVVFKNSFINRLSAGFEDLGNRLTFSETELSGSSDLIARARIYVKDKFIHKLVSIGANAALGIDFESSIGSEIVRVAIFGPAVHIEKISQDVPNSLEE